MAHDGESNAAGGMTLAKKGKGGNTIRAVTELVEPIVEELGLVLWDVRYEKEGASWFLRIFIDGEEGVDINDCEKVSRAIDPVLDEADPIPDSYYLEVSSPGVERDLVRDWHFESFLGERIKLHLIREQNGLRDLEGILTEYDASEKAVTVEDDDHVQHRIKKSDASYIRVCDWYEEGDTEQ